MGSASSAPGFTGASREGEWGGIVNLETKLSILSGFPEKSTQPQNVICWTGLLCVCMLSPLSHTPLVEGTATREHCAPHMCPLYRPLLLPVEHPALSQHFILSSTHSSPPLDHRPGSVPPSL